MHLLNFENLLEEEFKSLIIENFPLRWKEDVISHDLAKRLQTNFSQTELEGAQYPVTINWEVYKLFGQPEVDHGDLGILVRYKLLGGALVEGAGFLEAKLRDRKSS